VTCALWLPWLKHPYSALCAILGDFYRSRGWLYRGGCFVLCVGCAICHMVSVFRQMDTYKEGGEVSE
jgi:hypothetical protein